MSEKYKLVLVEPTPEMIEAAEEAYMPFGDMDLALRVAILAAPAVHGEPVSHDWDDQDKCRRCGDRDWYASAACTPKQQPTTDAEPAEQQPALVVKLPFEFGNGMMRADQVIAAIEAAGGRVEP